jgi:hypothetical protein
LQQDLQTNQHNIRSPKKAKLEKWCGYARIPNRCLHSEKVRHGTIGTSALVGDTTTISNGMAAPTESIGRCECSLYRTRCGDFGNPKLIARKRARHDPLPPFFGRSEEHGGKSRTLSVVATARSIKEI